MAFALQARIAHATPGIEASRAAALFALKAHGGLPVGALGVAVGLSQSATVRLVDRLVAEGVARRGDKLRRVVRVSLTARGMREAEKLAAACGAALDAVVDSLQPVERDALAWLSERVSQALDATLPLPKAP